MAQKRKDWNGLISGFSASDLVFLDESGCNTDMTRRYTRRMRLTCFPMMTWMAIYSQFHERIMKD